MRSVFQPVLAGLAVSLPAIAFAQVPNLAAASYIGVEIGTGKVNLSCPANTDCSPVDSSAVVRAGHRFDSAWAFEVTYTHVDADLVFLGRNRSAELTGFGIGAAYTLPLSASFNALLRVGAAANELEFQPAVTLGDSNPGKTITRSVKPYVGLALSWQFARNWSVSVNADWTRGDVRETAGSAKEAVSARTLGAGIAFNF